MEAAIYEDCHKLIEKFVNAGTVSFNSFCEQWKKLMFYHIYSFQTSVVEILLTTSTIYHIAKRTICAKDEFDRNLTTTGGNNQKNILRRIGGLYLLYSVYFKQPTREFVKVDVSMDTWREIKSFVDSLQLDPDMDCVRYVFWRLYQADAFHFTALDYMMGLEGLVDYDKIGYDKKESDLSHFVRVQLKQKLNSVYDMVESLNETTNLENDYNAVKQSIYGKDTSKRNNQTLPSSSIFHKIQNAMNDIKSVIDNENLPMISANKEETLKNISTTRRDIKRKAAGIIDNNDDLSSVDSEESESAEEETNEKIQKKLKEKCPRFTKPMGILTAYLPDRIAQDLLNETSSQEEDSEKEELEIEDE